MHELISLSTLLCLMLCAQADFELGERKEGKREVCLERDLWKSEERPTGEEEERRQEGGGMDWVQKISKE